jgi:hypothetical protein
MIVSPGLAGDAAFTKLQSACCATIELFLAVKNAGEKGRNAAVRDAATRIVIQEETVVADITSQPAVRRRPGAQDRRS